MEMHGIGANQLDTDFIASMVYKLMEIVTILNSEHSLIVDIINTLFQYHDRELLPSDFSLVP